MLRPAEICFGGLVTIFLLIGRWSPYRLQGIPTFELGLWREPRFWLAGSIVIAALLIAGTRQAVWLHPAVKRLIHGTGAAGLMLLLYMIGSVAWAPSEDLATYKAYELSLIGVVMAATIWTLPRLHPEGLHRSMWMTMLGLCFLLAMVTLLWGMHADRVAALGGGPNTFGRAMALMCLACMTFGYAGSRAWTWLWLAIWMLGLILVVLSGSRGALLAGTMAMLVTFTLFRMKITRKIVVLASTAILVVATLTMTEIGQRTAQRFQHRIVELTFERAHTAGRERLFQQAIEIGAEHPILGTGAGGYNALTGDHYPHNWFLELFAEGGAIALTLGIVMLALVAAGLWRWRQYLDPGMVGAFVLFFLFAQFSGELFDARGLFLMAVIALMPRYEPAPHHELYSLRNPMPA